MSSISALKYDVVFQMVVWQVSVSRECAESVGEVPGECTGSAGGSFFGSGWECGVELKHL